MSASRLTTTLLRDTVGAPTFGRARELLRTGAVQLAEYGPTGTIRGTVRSSSGHGSYEQRIELLLDDEGLVTIDSECSCPMEFNCKHVAAALLQLMERRGPLGTTASDGDGEPRASALPLPPATATAADPTAPRVLRAGTLAEEWFAALERSAPAAPAAATPPAKRLLFALALEPPAPALRLYVVPLRKEGGWGRVDPYRRPPREVLANPPRFLDDTDLDLLTRLLPLDDGPGGLEPTGRAAPAALRALAEAGRLLLDPPTATAAPLRWGGARRGTLGWHTDARGRQRLLPQLPAAAEARLAGADPVWWLEAGAIGTVDLDLPPALLQALLRGPTLAPDELQALGPRLATLAARWPDQLPPPPAAPREVIRGVAPRPRLHLQAQAERGGKRSTQRVGARAVLALDYGGVRIEAPLADEPDTTVVALGPRVVAVERDRAAEQAIVAQLDAAGLPAEAPVFAGFRWPPSAAAPLPEWRRRPADEQHWPAILADQVPAWRAAGWEVAIDADFPYTLATPSDWSAQIDEDAGNRWFEIGVNVQVEGRRLPLAPLLAESLERFGRAEMERRTAAGRDVLLPWPDGAEADGVPRRWIALPAARLAPLLRLLDLWFDGGLRRTEAKARLSPFDLGALDALDALGIAARGAERLRALARDLKGLAGIAPIAPPQGLRAQLRPYQAQGLAWLDFLRAHGLAGILADDMGLGKTLQTLALLLREKEEGRLSTPALVVAPTSLVRNWADEAARFTPGLRVLIWHGLQRKAQAAALAEHDLVLTSYALLPRDAALLAALEWHVIVLDESQRIKNARSQAAQALSGMRARHRFCLSGTPLENHLGELWSQFNFLLPGLLGDADRFRRVWRTPIEKGGDSERAVLLAQRVRPFMLRRTKAEVAAELPPKTETVLKVDLEGAQRDLYETVRAAMDQRVREAIARRGLAQSQVVVLDALLKMRQVCCDPLLLPEQVRAGFAKAASAKRKLLGELLPDLIEDGRRVLLFSSFASMLDLIEGDLRAAGTPYSKLTGASTDRAAQVAAFQSGTKPVFLISLKAGGVGLNLTAADAVIVYDPWWNPAAEQQAVDRAHRIGQDKPVFVYKLIAAGTVEERILDLQARKADLAARLLAGAATDLALTEDDFAALFAPTP
jgi:superfamily II DNA or RNA helicase